MKKRILTSWLLLTALLIGRGLSAQEGGYRFQPPTPPPLDGADFDDSDDEMDMGDGGYRPPPTPPPPPSGGLPPGNGDGMGGADSRPAPGAGFDLTTTPGKFRFKIVEGEFYEKGKKRTRGNQIHVSGSSKSE